jgi:hypothetical protein
MVSINLFPLFVKVNTCHKVAKAKLIDTLINLISYFESNTSITEIRKYVNNVIKLFRRNNLIFSFFTIGFLGESTGASLYIRKKEKQ